jgi:hypothetical protein
MTMKVLDLRRVGRGCYHVSMDNTALLLGPTDTPLFHTTCWLKDRSVDPNLS